MNLASTAVGAHRASLNCGSEARAERLPRWPGGRSVAAETEKARSAVRAFSKASYAELRRRYLLIGIPMHEWAASAPPPIELTYSPWFLNWVASLKSTCEITMAVLAVLLVLQFTRRRYVASIYWGRTSS